MHRKILNLSLATACIVGGGVLVLPASGQAAYRSCEEMMGTRCTGSGYTYCEMLPGQNEPMVCWNNRWTLA